MGLTSWDLVEMYERNVEPLEILKELDGFYECPKDGSGKRLGPLVGYAGRDDKGRQLVGDVYANCAMFEEWPELLLDFAKSRRFWALNSSVSRIGSFCGSPMGGLAFAQALALTQKCRYIFSEKKVTELVPGGKEKSELVFGRHQPKPDERVVIVEDVANNFTTTDQQIKLILDHDALPVGIFCLLNRSMTISGTYHSPTLNYSIPVAALIHHPFFSYNQDDPEVASDVAAGNVIWKPKASPESWGTLMMAMRPLRSPSAE